MFLRNNSKQIAGLFALLGGLLLFGTPARLAAQNAPDILDQAPPPPTTSKALPVLDSTLNGLALQAQSNSLLGEGNLPVLVSVTMQDFASANELVRMLAKLQGELVSQYQRWLDVRLPASQLATLKEMPGVWQVRSPLPAFMLNEPPPTPPRLSQWFSPMRAGSILSQGVNASNAQVWHSAGITGSGVRIAITDYFQNYTQAQAVGELPANLSFYPDQASLNLASKHGTAVAEIVHDMAPGAQLVLSRPPNDCNDFAALISGLAAQGVQVISSSVGELHCGAGDGNVNDDPVASAVQNARNQYGTLFVQAAGNQAKRHWVGSMTDSNANGWLEFSPGIEVLKFQNQLYASTAIEVSLRWSSWSTTNQDYDLYLMRYDGANWVNVSALNSAQTGTQTPTESGYLYTPANASASTYGLAIYKYSASGTHIFDLITYSQDLLTPLSARSLVGPATNANTIAVGAYNVQTSGYPLESYSSQGSTLAVGGTLGSGLLQTTITGPTVVGTWTYGDSNVGYRFNGTSAATPHVAGAAALIWSTFHCVNAGTVRNSVHSVLTSRAQDAGTNGYDYLYGWGRLWLGSPLAHTNNCSQFVYLPIVIK